MAEVAAAPLDADWVELVGDSHGGLLRPLSWLAADLGCLIGVGECEADCYGVTDAVSRCIEIKEGLPLNMRVKVLIHELAHALLAFELPPAEVPELSRYEEEIIAAATAYLVCAKYRLDSSCSSIPYLSASASIAGVDTIGRHADVIDELATRLVAAIDANHREHCEPRA